MTMDQPFKDRVLDQLAGLGDITCRPMFGGWGIYWEGIIFAILFGDRLYLKVDDQSRGDFVSRGMPPFRPNDRQTLKSYYEVPPDVLDDPEALLSWAREAIRVGQNSSDPESRSSWEQAALNNPDVSVTEGGTDDG